MFTKPIDCDKILLYFCNAFLTRKVRNRTCGVMLIIRPKADVRFVAFVKARVLRLSASADREERLLMRSGNRII